MTLHTITLSAVATILMPYRSTPKQIERANKRTDDEFHLPLARITARKKALVRMARAQGHHMREKDGEVHWAWHVRDPDMIHAECEKCHEGIYLWVRGPARYAPIAENGQQLWEAGGCSLADWPVELSRRYWPLAFGMRYECAAMEFVSDGVRGVPYLPAEKWPGRREMLASGKFKSLDEANRIMRGFHDLGAEYRTSTATAAMQKHLVAGLPLFEGAQP